MPDFLDFVFPFGESEKARDFHFSGFRAESQFSKNPSGEQALAVPSLGRSGRQFQMCFNLRSVEQTYYDMKRRPWSIRQTAIYHSFDVETGRTVWIFIKGNDVIRGRIQSAVNDIAKIENNDIASFDTLTAAFGSSLNVHTMLCEWARENWRWYINFLEGVFQDTTRSSLHASVDAESRPAYETFDAPSRSRTAPAPMKRQRTVSSVVRSPFNRFKRTFSMKVPSSSPGTESNPIQLQSVPTANTFGLSGEKEFSFNKLQSVQNLEEKATETILVLKTNMDVLGELRKCYMRFQESENWPDELRGQAKDRLIRFANRVSDAISGLGMEKSRLETLLSHISNRKMLVSMEEPNRFPRLTESKLTGILEHQNVKMNMEIAQKAQMSAEKAQVSADNMEIMTGQMQRIAEKTERETVSMRIVTYVTLFFLPGTFVSVSNYSSNTGADNLGTDSLTDGL